MRISDWSSDVCSSDLGDGQHRPLERPPDAGDCGVGRVGVLEEGPVDAGRQLTVLLPRLDPRAEITFGAFLGGDIDGARCPQLEYHLSAPQAGRSEENKSELPALMRISYADFCLQK